MIALTGTTLSPAGAITMSARDTPASACHTVSLIRCQFARTAQCDSWLQLPPSLAHSVIANGPSRA